jgi:hypothetical protein
LVRQLFEQLAAIRTTGPAAPPPDLAEPIAGMWQRLAAVELPLDYTGQANLFAGATRRLEARPHLRRYGQLSERIRQAGPEEMQQLVAEKNQMYRDLQARFPEEFRIYGYHVGRRRPRRSHNA